MNIRRNLTLGALLLSLDQQAQFMQREIEEPSIGNHLCISRTLDGCEIIGGSDSTVAVITKMDASGHVQWAMRYPEAVEIGSIGTFPQGDHYALGLKTPLGSTDPSELIILQLDTSGQVNWSLAWAVPDLVFKLGSSCIVHDANGDLIVTAETYDDAYVLRISRFGAVKWSVWYQLTEGIGNNISGISRSTQSGPAHTVYTATAYKNSGNHGFCLFATDTLGQCLWSRQYNVSAQFVMPRDLLVTSSGQLVLVGWMPPAIDWSYAFVATLDTLGVLLGPVHATAFGSDSKAWQQVFELADGSLAVTGMLHGTNTSSAIVARYDGSGNYSWAVVGEQLYQTNYVIEPDGSFSTASGDLYYMGSTMSWTRFTRGNIHDQILCTEISSTITSTPVTPTEAPGPTPVPGPLPVPYTVTAVPFMPAEQPYCGTVDVQASPPLPSLSIDPVPAADRITVHGWTVDRRAATCTLVDARGQEVLRVPVATSSNSIVIDVSGLPQGSYMITLTGAEQRWVGRCMIAR